MINGAWAQRSHEMGQIPVNTVFCRIIKGAVSGLLISLIACSGTEGTDTPGPDTPLDARFVNLTEGTQVSQIVDLQVEASGGGGIASLSFTAPPELVGIDLDAAAEKLAAQWDTTLDDNGTVQVGIEARGKDGTSVVKTLNLTRANVSAALRTDYEDGAYVRQGSPLILKVNASAFGSSPSLNRVEVRALEGGGLSPALPIQGVLDGTGAYVVNLGSPSAGDIDMTLNAVNNSGEISAPLKLTLSVLRNDIISTAILSDFEVTPDGQTGLLLGAVTGTTDLKLDFINLSDPASPTFSGASITLQPGVTSSTSGPMGNLILNPVDATKAYVLFPSSKVVYRIDVATKTVSLKTNITSLPRPETGTALGRNNRSPYAIMTPDGNYIFAWDTIQPAPLIMLRTSDMVQLGATTGQVTSPFPPPATTNTKGFGYMVAHPGNRYVYAINNWGLDTAGSVDLAVFDISGQAFIDFNATTARVIDAFSVENASSSYKVGQQPGITPDGTRLLLPVCNGSTGATLLKRYRLDVASPTNITADASVDLSSVYCGGISTISKDGRYALISSSNPNKPTGAVVDLLNGLALSVTFPNGVKDGIFSPDSGKVLAESIAYADRDMGELSLNTSPQTVLPVLVPGAAGLMPPDSDIKLRYHLLTSSGGYAYQLYAANVNDGSSSGVAKGTSLSVFSLGVDGFIFPNP